MKTGWMSEFTLPAGPTPLPVALQTLSLNPLLHTLSFQVTCSQVIDGLVPRPNSHEPLSSSLSFLLHPVCSAQGPVSVRGGGWH